MNKVFDLASEIFKILDTGKFDSKQINHMISLAHQDDSILNRALRIVNSIQEKDVKF